MADHQLQGVAKCMSDHSYRTYQFLPLELYPTTDVRLNRWAVCPTVYIGLTTCHISGYMFDNLCLIYYVSDFGPYLHMGINVHSNLLRLIRDGGWGGGRYTTTYSLHCHHQNNCIKAGSCVRHFNVSLTVWAKSQVSVHNRQFLKRKQSRSGSNRGPSAYQPSALPLGNTGSQFGLYVPDSLYRTRSPCVGFRPVRLTDDFKLPGCQTASGMGMHKETIISDCTANHPESTKQRALEKVP